MVSAYVVSRAALPTRLVSRCAIGVRIAPSATRLPTWSTQATPRSARPELSHCLTRRSFSSSSRTLNESAHSSAQASPADPTGKAIALDYELHEPPADAQPKAGDAKSLVVCHGLFGSKQNWRSLARGMAKRFGVPVYAVDLRNHGTSPHVKEGMSYYDMALDLIKFFKDHQLTDVALIGHSMGGKAVMSFALHPDLPQDALQYLISVDMSPARGPLSKEFAQYVDAMASIQAEGVESRGQADTILKETEPDLGIRQFLLTNLHRPDPKGPWRFRIPIATIKEHLSQIGDFPFDSKDRQWNGRMLFMKGEKSKYLNRKNRPDCEAYFPNNKQVILPAGHWVQAEKPHEFVEVLDAFLSGRDLSKWQ